jgi:VanZ family protein
MVIIFSASSDSGSFQHSSRIIRPLVLWLFPSASHQTVHTIVYIVRKCAHMTEYAILALLILRALQVRCNRSQLWEVGDAKLAFTVIALYAASDEFHQRFVPSREASVRDVAIDCFGAACALAVVWLLRRKTAAEQKGEPLADNKPQ